MLSFVMPDGDLDLGQHPLRWWLVAWWHQAITWTNVDLIISDVLWHSPESNSSVSAWATILYSRFENLTYEINATCPRGLWVKFIKDLCSSLSMFCCFFLLFFFPIFSSPSDSSWWQEISVTVGKSESRKPSDMFGPEINGWHSADGTFKCIFCKGKVWFWIKISLNFVPEVTINYMAALVWVMVLAWNRRQVIPWTNVDKDLWSVLISYGGTGPHRVIVQFQVVGRVTLRMSDHRSVFLFYTISCLLLFYEHWCF